MDWASSLINRSLLALYCCNGTNRDAKIQGVIEKILVRRGDLCSDSGHVKLQTIHSDLNRTITEFNFVERETATGNYLRSSMDATHHLVWPSARLQLSPRLRGCKSTLDPLGTQVPLRTITMAT